MNEIFSPFPRLPPEIRCQIWITALHSYDDRPVLGIFREGCWKATAIHPSDPTYWANYPRSNYWLDMHCDLLDGLQRFLPTAFVNHEARVATLKSFKWQNVEYKQPLFAPSFNLHCDVVYIPTNRFEAFMEDQHSWTQPNTRGMRVRFQLLAVTPDLLLVRAQEFFRSLVAFSSLRTILVIIRDPPALNAPGSVASQRRWTYESFHEGVLSWDQRGERFELVNGDTTENSRHCRDIEEALRGVKQPNASWPQLARLEIRPVIVKQIM
ncbi:hypothetical protein ANO11243_076020 [Dothideomycetidae sp. 11243]|nr:hypothetical protein ANO11243_076020 [fungal sp. No.11243]